MVGVRELPQRQLKENMAEFVARKREIFLVQMSLDTKRAEIRALQVRSPGVTCVSCPTLRGLSTTCAHTGICSRFGAARLALQCYPR